MKKWIALMAALVLCLGLACSASAEAEVPSFYWAEKADEAAAHDGGFYTLDDLGVTFWVPDYLELVDLTQEQVDRGLIARFENSDVSNILVITLVEGKPYDEFYQRLTDNGIEGHMAYINDLPAIVYHYVRGENDESNCAAFFIADGWVLEFVYTGDDITFSEDSGFSVYSIQLVGDEETAEPAETASFYWEDSAAQLEEAGIEGDFYKLAGVNVIVWIPSFLELEELSDADIDGGSVAYFSGADGDCFVSVTLRDLGVSYEEGLALLKDRGAQDIKEIVVNDIPLVLYAYDNGDGQARTSAVLFTSDGFGLNFDFSTGDEAFDDYVTYIMTSIQLDS